MAAALELAGVAKSFGSTEVIRDVTLSIPQGERHALIGPNGAGKSTLFNLITGRLALTRGQILLDGADVTGWSPYEIYRKRLARSFQITNIVPRLSVRENLRSGALWTARYGYSFWHRIDGLRDLNRHTDEVLEQIGLGSRRDLPAGLLTYAEQRALEIGITIVGGAEVILLDEPTAGMSRSETERAVQLIRTVTQGRTLLMVEHDMGVVFDLADRISVLVYGTLLASDTPERIKANAAVQQAYLGTHLD